jgi:hypothetical protein
MFLPLPAIIVAAPLIIGVVDGLPSFDVNPTCRGAAATAGAGGRGSDVCVRTELGARDQLAKEWEQFPSVDRTRCIQLTNMTRMPSYVQVLTCLEMARDARQLEAPGRRSTVGSDR